MAMNLTMRCFSIALLFCSIMAFRIPQVASPFRCNNGKVSFTSNAALEMIKASSNKLLGAIDPSNNSFAWSVDARSFEGFNSPLQQEHFNENYIEYTKYPHLSFTGKIIEKIDFQQNGRYTVRAKGKLIVHGVEQERIIRCELDVTDNRIRVHAQFTVPLADHNISIPRIVNQKIAKEVSVTVEAALEAESK